MEAKNIKVKESVSINPSQIVSVEQRGEVKSNYTFVKKVNWYGIEYNNVYFNSIKQIIVKPDNVPDKYIVRESDLHLKPRIKIILASGTKEKIYFNTIEELREWIINWIPFTHIDFIKL